MPNKKKKGRRRDHRNDETETAEPCPSRVGSTTTNTAAWQQQEAKGSSAFVQQKDEKQASRVHNEGVLVYQNIHASNVQVGNNNTINENTPQMANDEEKDDCEGAVPKLYSQVVAGYSNATNVCTGKVISQTIHANKITNIINTIQPTQHQNARQQDDGGNVKRNPRNQKALFLESVNDFKCGHYVLLVGKHRSLVYADPLAYLNWIAILDFDPEGESCGLYSRLHDMLSKLRSLHVDNIQEKIQNSISDLTTNWIFVRGTSGKPNTMLPSEPSEWRKKVNKDLDAKLSLLSEFQASVTKLTFVVVWPKDDHEAFCMHVALVRIVSMFETTHIVIIDGHEEMSDMSILKLNDLKSEKMVNVFKLNFREFCNACMSVAEPVTSHSRKYMLPTKDGMKGCKFSDDEYPWLNEYLDVLYAEKETDNSYTPQMIEKELDQFCKGGTLSWNWWYAVKPGHAEIERDKFREIIDHIRGNHIKKKESGLVTLFHDPGGGGTTLAQRILWEFKTTTPCVQVKRYSEAHVGYLVERLTTISDATKLPLIVMIDGECENKVKSLQIHMKELDIVVVLLYVRRRNILDDETQYGNGTFILKGDLSPSEANVLKLKIRSLNKRRQRNAEKLITDVLNGEKRTIFEFGLAVHSYEYRGIKAYVEGHLHLQYQDCKFQNWQVALAYLSLVYFYGHSSMPCHFFTNLLSKDGTKPIFEVTDFPHEMHEFIVQGSDGSTRNTVRISHFYVAKEILERTLLMMARCKSREQSVSPFLCEKAKGSLGEFSQNFIEQVEKETGTKPSDVILRVLVNTFITRENKDLLEEDDTTPSREKTRLLFSPLLEDASVSAPYTDRFEIYRKLADTFPSEAQFRAHLGRLYLLCRPEDKTNAKKNLKEAYDIIYPRITECRSVSKLPHHDRFCIRNICHMYGSVLSNDIYNYSGRNYLSNPRIELSNDEFVAASRVLLGEVVEACKLFETCREMTSPGHEQCVGYIDEIRLRLMYCKFLVHRNNVNNIEEYLKINSGDMPNFVEDCYTALKVLFDELYDLIDANEMGKNSVESLHVTYIELFRSKSFKCGQCKDTPSMRRMDIGKLKRKYDSKKKCKSYLEHLKDPEEIEFIVKNCEENFVTAERSDKGIDGDYREWINAIRHPAFHSDYPLDKVYDRVKKWKEHVLNWNNIEKQTVAKFYMFVLASVLGFGTNDNPGNQELLKEAQFLKADFRQHAKFSRNADCRREFLGPPVDNVRRLVQSFTRRRTEMGTGLRNHEITTLEVRMGWICPPNRKPSSGYIELDLGPMNRESVRIFFVPEKWDLKSSSYRGKRVQFVIEFNMVHGYEAHFVKLVEQAVCSNKECGNKLSYRSGDTTVTCCNCKETTSLDTVT